MIDLTLSSDEEEARSPKRQRVQTQPQAPAERVGSLQAPAQAAAAAAPATAAAPAVAWPVGESFGSLGLHGHDADGDWDNSGARSGVAAAGPGPSSQALAAAAAADGRGGGGKGGNAAGAGAGAVVTEGGGRRGGSGRRRAQLGGGGGVDDDDGDWEPEDDHDRRVLAGTTAAAATGGGGGGGGGAWGGEERDDDDDWGDTEVEEEEAGGAATKKRGQAGAGGRKRLTAEERERAKAEKAEEKERAKAAKAAERERAKAAKEAEKEAKKAAKEATKRAKEADKEDKKYQKEVENALKASMVPRYLRLLLSNTLAAHPLGMAMQTHAPVAREGRHETFEVEVHRGMPLAAAGYRYCMWGMRVPAGAAERLTAAAAGGGGGAEGCALEPCGLPDVAGTGKPLLLFPLLALVLLGDELLRHLEADTAAAAGAAGAAGAAAGTGAAGAVGAGAAAAAGAAGAGSGRVGSRGPLSRLYGEVAAAHPGCTLLVYVVGLQEAMSRRQRANKAFPREAVEDLLFDITVGMPAVRLHTDCPDGDWAHAATFLVNYGWALAGAPKKRQAAQPGYLNNFGNKSTIPLRVIKDVLRDRAAAAAAADDDDETESLVPALVLCDALSHLVVPQSAAAVAAEYGSLGAIIEALKARPDARFRERLLENCPIPGAVAGKQRLTRAGPAAAASLARFLTIHNGRDVWVEAGLE